MALVAVSVTILSPQASDLLHKVIANKFSDAISPVDGLWLIAGAEVEEVGSLLRDSLQPRTPSFLVFELGGAMAGSIAPRYSKWVKEHS
jgi:hypothetical protein